MASLLVSLSFWSGKVIAKIVYRFRWYKYKMTDCIHLNDIIILFPLAFTSYPCNVASWWTARSIFLRVIFMRNHQSCLYTASFLLGEYCDVSA